MTKQEWLELAHKEQDKLVSLIRAYHPMSPGEKRELSITAGNAERACDNVRQSIQREWTYEETPERLFNRALLENNYYRLYRLLNAAWFGVPESTSCWQIEGFREAVTLLEDPVEEE